MGANAQTSVPAFTAGQVLTAQQQTEINTGIPVFATTTTRDAAFGGTGEKTLAEGQFAYIEASNTTQYYDGAAWQTVNGGWAYISTTSISAASSANFNNVFTTTYENYRIIINVQNSAAASLLSMRLRVGGSDNSTSNYAYIGSGYTTANALDNSNAEGASSWEIGYCDTASIGFYSDFMIYNPQATLRTTMFGASMKGISATRLANRFYGCLFNATTSFDGFTITPSLGTITGKVTVLGQVIS